MADTYYRITPRQLRYIWFLADSAGMDEYFLHQYVYDRVGGEHISELRKEQAAVIIDGLSSIVNFDSNAESASTVRAASDAQIKKIYRVMGTVVRLTPDKGEFKPRLNGYLRKFASVENVKDLTTKEASGVIVGLEKLLESLSKEGYAHDGS